VHQLRGWLERVGLEGPSRAEGLQALAPMAEVATQVLLDAGEAVELRGLLYRRRAVEATTEAVARARQHGPVAMAAVRDILGTSRNYVLRLLEYLDTVGVTRRQGDLRVAGPRLVRDQR